MDLLTKGEKEIILHGLGAAIQRCCNLAIQTQLAFPGTHEIEVNTGTIDLVGKNLYDLHNLLHNPVKFRIYASVQTNSTYLIFFQMISFRW